MSSWAPLLWGMSSSMEKAVRNLEVKVKQETLFCSVANTLHFRSVKKSARPHRAKCLYLHRGIKECWAVMGREITPNNWAGRCCSVVYLAHGMGILVGTLSNWWNPDTQFPLHYVMHGLTRLPARVSCQHCAHARQHIRRELASGCSMYRYTLNALNLHAVT